MRAANDLLLQCVPQKSPERVALLPAKREARTQYQHAHVSLHQQHDARAAARGDARRSVRLTAAVSESEIGWSYEIFRMGNDVETN